MRSVLVLALLSAGCGDGGDFDPPHATVSGVVEIGDTIAQAQVYADYYDNNIRDDVEVQTTTDASGHFTLTFENIGPLFPHSIVAVVAKDSISVGANLPVGFDVHLRAALDVDHETDGPISSKDDVTVTGVVISPFTTIVVSELGNNPTLTQPEAVATVAAAVAGSQLPLSGMPLDVMEDYVADSSDDAKHLRLVAGTFAAILGTAIADANNAQSVVDANKATYFDPIVVALAKQLEAIASGTFMFTEVFTAQEQMAVMQNPENYTHLFIDPTAAEADIKAELDATASDLAMELEANLEGLLEELEVDFVRFVTGELIYLAVEILGEAL